MEKVKVTREQAEAIEHTRETMGDAALILLHAKAENGWIGSLSKRLNGMPILKLVDALRVGYEVELEEGDWVTAEFNFGKVIGKLVLAEGGGRIDSSEYKVPQFIPMEDLRLSTPEEIEEEKERRWWSKHGRGVWDLKKGDILICDGHARIVDKVVDFNEKSVLFVDNDWEYYENVIEEYKVSCFVENRLDVNTNERETVGRDKE